MDGPQPTEIAAPLVLSGAAVSVGPHTSANALANKIDWQPSFEMNWKIAVKEGDERTFGVTTNRMYVTLGTPIRFGGLLYETTLDIGCRNADGKAAEKPAFDAIWSDFTDRNVRRVDGVQMKYWADEGDPQLEDIDAACQNLSAMLNPVGVPAPKTGGVLKGIGTCRAWSFLLHAVGRAQGIPVDRPKEVTANDKNDVDDPDVSDAAFRRHALMLIKNRTFPGPNPALAACAPFDRFFASTTSAWGIPAQGVPNPRDYFQNHFVIRYAGKIYDPSYGAGPFSNDQEWQDASLAGVSKLSTCRPPSSYLARIAPLRSVIVTIQ